jgi:hypothetical protein
MMRDTSPVVPPYEPPRLASRGTTTDTTVLSALSSLAIFRRLALRSLLNPPAESCRSHSAGTVGEDTLTPPPSRSRRQRKPSRRRRCDGGAQEQPASTLEPEDPSGGLGRDPDRDSGRAGPYVAPAEHRACASRRSARRMDAATAPVRQWHGQGPSSASIVATSCPFGNAARIRDDHSSLFGKGRKERICPLWPQTAELLRALLLERGGQPRPDQSLFVNHRGGPLTRSSCSASSTP